MLLFDYKSKLHKLVVYKKRPAEKGFSQFPVFSLFEHYHDLKSKFYGKTKISLDTFSDFKVLLCHLMHQ